jgi:hypothetical protein
MRDRGYVSYDYPAMSTQGNFTFWSPVYQGSGGAWTHVIPSGAQLGLAGELRVPVEWFDLTAELVWLRNRTREAVEGFQATHAERFGALDGFGYYAQLGFWVLGKRSILGEPGYQNMPHVSFEKPEPKSPPHAVQLLLRWEQLRASYQGASRAGLPDPKGIDGDIKADALSIGAN